MPTFRSIGLHPDLHGRLVTESKGQTQQKYVAIDTPHALLSRHPASLKVLDKEAAQTKAISYKEALKFRYEISKALIQTTTTGKRARHIYRNVDDSPTHPTKRLDGFVSLAIRIQYQQAYATSFSGLSTGCTALDQFLAVPMEYNSILTKHTTNTVPTGVPFGVVTQLAGPPGTGKSQVALQLAASPVGALRQCWYLCSQGSLVTYAKRLEQLVNAMNDTAQNILNRTWLQLISDEHQLLGALANIEAIVASFEQPQPTLLVLDSVSGCISLQDDTTLARHIAMTLRKLAQEYGMAVVVVNGSVQRTDERGISISKPALGRVWESTPHISLWFEKSNTNSPNCMRVTLEKHPAKCVSASCHFVVTSSGVHDVNIEEE